MAPRSSLIRFAFVCIVLAVLVMTAESQGMHPAKAPSPHGHGPAASPKAHAPAPSPKAHAPAPSPKAHAPAPSPKAHAPAPAPASSAVTFSAYPQLIATALVGALSFVF